MQPFGNQIHPHISLKTKGKIRLVTIFFCKTKVDVKSGRSSVKRVTPIETLRSLEEVPIIVWDKMNIITARSIFKNGRKIYSALYHTYLSHKFV